MTMRPFRETKPGGNLSSSEMNRAFSNIERNNRLTVAAPLVLSPDWQGQKLSIALRLGWYVRITAAGGSGSSGCSGGSGGSGSIPSYFYSGIEQYSLTSGLIDDCDSGQRFDACTFPLVELSESTSVPVGALVWAQLAASRDHAEFLWEPGGSGSSSGSCHEASGSGCVTASPGCCVRISEMFQRVGSDCQYRDGCLCITASGGITFIPDSV